MSLRIFLHVWHNHLGKHIFTLMGLICHYPEEQTSYGQKFIDTLFPIFVYIKNTTVINILCISAMGWTSRSRISEEQRKSGYTFKAFDVK